ncbi:MAG: DUF5050 domain-containing protein [Ignavibacteriae bacterium]|nr:DUF5050 domain-containing protein [Ignavibacteriota bacterium]
MKYLKIILSFTILLFVFKCQDTINGPNEPIEKIVFVSVDNLNNIGSTSNIFVINGDGSNLKQLTNSDSYYSTNPIITFDNKYIIYESNRENYPNIFSMTLDGSEIKNLTNSYSFDFEPQISSNNLIVFERFDFNNGIMQNPQIYKMTIDGGSQVNLTNDIYPNENPKIDFKGEYIYYISRISGSNHLNRIDVYGKNKKLLTDSTLDVTIFEDDFTISEDGKKIAFIAYDNYSSIMDLYIMNSDGSEIKNLTNDIYYQSNPKFSRDNSKIVYDLSGHTNLPGKRIIKIITIDGNTSINLVELEKAANPIFNSTGEKIIFTAESKGSSNIFSINIDGTNLKNISNRDCDDFSPRVLR